MLQSNRLRIVRMLCALVLVLGLVASPAFAKKPVVGEPAPNFELTLLDGTKVTRDDLKGQAVVLNFWATWCEPCKRELPLLDAYYKIQRKAGLRVFAVTTEDSVPLSKLKPVTDAMTIPTARRIKGPYGILKGVPTNFVIDRAGNVRYAKAKVFSLDKLNEILVPLLQEPAPAAQ